ncbi:hypothetical protein OAU50_02250 [Planctomycetota bacterium]|nr:hypothetical protein [Planctomycetota bacterium]
MLSNSPANYPELERIERRDRAQVGLPADSRRGIILYHWSQGRSIEGIAFELETAGYANHSFKSIARALREARKAGYEVKSAEWQNAGEPLATRRADLGKYQRPILPDEALAEGMEGFNGFLFPDDLSAMIGVSAVAVLSSKGAA